MESVVIEVGLELDLLVAASLGIEWREATRVRMEGWHTSVGEILSRGRVPRFSGDSHAGVGITQGQVFIRGVPIVWDPPSEESE